MGTLTDTPALPLMMIAWALAGMGLDIGLARFTYGVTLPSMRRELGLDYTASGILNAVHLLGYLAGTAAAPALLRRMATGTLARAGHVLFAMGALACALAPGVTTLAIGRLASGIGAAGGITAILVIVIESVAARHRPAVSAAVWAGIGAAVALSGAAAPALLTQAGGWRAGFAASAAVAAALSLGFPPRSYATRPAGQEAGAPASIHPPRGSFGLHVSCLIAAYALFGVAYIGYVTFAGARLAATGASLQAIRVVWVTLGLSCMVGSGLAVLGLRARFGRQAALTAALLAAGAGSLVAAIPGLAASIAGAALFGLGMTSSPALVTAYLRDRSTAATYPQLVSVATIGLGTGQLIGPVATGFLADHFGLAAAFLFAAAVFALAAACALADEWVNARPGGS